MSKKSNRPQTRAGHAGHSRTRTPPQGLPRRLHAHRPDLELQFRLHVRGGRIHGRQEPGPHHPRAGIRPLRQSHAIGSRAQAGRHRRRRTRHPVFHRHERGHPDAHGLHEKGRPHHFHQRLLPADARFCDQLSRQIRNSKHAGRADHRRHRKSHPAQHQHHFHRVAHQSLPARARPPGHRQSRQTSRHIDDD